jgi:hypothetical protein
MARTSTIVAILVSAGVASANPVFGVYNDTPGCDNHGTLLAYEELGTAPLFPVDELIVATHTFVSLVPCPPMHAGLPSALVVMTNLSGRDWENLFYVANPETSLTNVDGLAASAAAPALPGLAFRIDSVGVNRPLISESFAADGIFSAGETWEFLIQDYTNLLGLPPDALGSLDFAGASVAIPGVAPSSGSIVAMQVPGPGVLSLIGLGGLLAARRRR